MGKLGYWEGEGIEDAQLIVDCKKKAGMLESQKARKLIAHSEKSVKG